MAIHQSLALGVLCARGQDSYAKVHIPLHILAALNTAIAPVAAVAEKLDVS